jgi:hypothetical protein
MRDKRWLSELGYHGTPRRDDSMLNGFLDLLGALALAGFIGVVLWVIR